MPINSLSLDTGCFMVHGTTFEICDRFTDFEPIGQGASGVVCAAFDKEKEQRVAIKKIESIFHDKFVAKSTLRELRILRHLKHENLVDLRMIFMPGTKEDFNDIYSVSGLMETDLAAILESSFALTENHSKYFLYQILRGIKYVHSAGVIHRDLKPRNLLLNSDCDLKICDFGLAKFKSSDKAFSASSMTEYICTRWYRAPEVLCSWTEYTASIDVWSIGCIFGEMLNRKAVFPGRNTQHQLQLIIELLKPPSVTAIMKIPNEKCRAFIKSFPAHQGKFEVKKSFSVFFPEASDLAVDLLTKALRFDPEERTKVDSALTHEYLAELHCPEDEPTRSPLDTAEFEFERREIDEEAVREELFNETLVYHPELLQRYKAEQAQQGDSYDISSYPLLEAGESDWNGQKTNKPEPVMMHDNTFVNDDSPAASTANPDSKQLQLIKNSTSAASTADPDNLQFMQDPTSAASAASLQLTQGSTSAASTALATSAASTSWASRLWTSSRDSSSKNQALPQLLSKDTAVGLTPEVCLTQCISQCGCGSTYSQQSTPANSRKACKNACSLEANTATTLAGVEVAAFNPVTPRGGRGQSSLLAHGQCFSRDLQQTAKNNELTEETSLRFPPGKKFSRGKQLDQAPRALPQAKGSSQRFPLVGRKSLDRQPMCKDGQVHVSASRSVVTTSSTGLTSVPGEISFPPLSTPSVRRISLHLKRGDPCRRQSK
eukprot:gnl/MRDRNA2_/MRDRNA2_73557_c0_seq1.p1 gnl/MRDRNA2_/MRDRNA2_73557_c0~~gnl/MRDRNA2_/MRDRNA2_73557_c0_seq1.p1  ORF type:complete len:717 (+),score=122.69 gnl/MRDRNA2_/MRDRNA2_73557_c0_seq1:84-2234(+)